MFHLLIIVRRNIQQKVIQMEFILEIGQDKDGKGALKWVGRGDKMIIDISRELFCILFFVISVIGYIFYKKRNDN